MATVSYRLDLSVTRINLYLYENHCPESTEYITLLLLASKTVNQKHHLYFTVISHKYVHIKWYSFYLTHPFYGDIKTDQNVGHIAGIFIKINKNIGII